MSERRLKKKLGPDCVERISGAIASAEQETSAEIAVFVREWTFVSSLLGRRPTVESIRRRAEKLFVEHRLDATREHSAIMLYVSLRERVAVVLGDTAIHAKVAESDWQAITAELAQHAGRGHEVDGIVAAVARAGHLLARHFPARADDTNELSDIPNLA